MASYPTLTGQPMAGFRTYLENSVNNPFVLNLRDCTLMECIEECIRAKSRMHPNYRVSLGCLLHNLKAIEESYGVTLMPVQVTDIFWSYFISFCQSRGLRLSTIETMAWQVRSILTWATKYQALVSPSYTDFCIPRSQTNLIALTADEVSRIAYFDIDRYYADRRKDVRNTMHRVRDMFVLSCNLYQRHSDMVRIAPSCFERNIFRICQQKTGNLAVVNIDKYSIEPKTTYRLLEKYNYEAPYKAMIGNYNHYLHTLMCDIGLTDIIRMEERVNGVMKVKEIPKWKLISSHTARRTAITVNVLRGHNIHAIKRCSGHTDLRIFDNYVRDED